MNWLHTLWFNYVWPSIKGNGPEELVSLAALGLLGMVMKRAHDKMDHIIKHHPGIPAFKGRNK